MSNSRLEDIFKELIEYAGEDIHRPDLKDTPERAARAFEYITQGYRQDLSSIVNSAIFESDITEMVVIKDIELYSTCEHHLLPFIGKCHIAYIPQGKILGLSKFARIVDYFSRRLQVQERLTGEIANCIQKVTGAAGVGVIIEAKHLCMMMRGVEKQSPVMTTSMMLGSLKHQSSYRIEFLNLVKKSYEF